MATTSTTYDNEDEYPDSHRLPDEEDDESGDVVVPQHRQPPTSAQTTPARLHIASVEAGNCVPFAITASGEANYVLKLSNGTTVTRYVHVSASRTITSDARYGALPRAIGITFRDTGGVPVCYVS